MKRDKDEEKLLGPMFPRILVNDTEKGGPRAPPRNKMALYEQFSVPSQRFHTVLPHNQNVITPNSVPYSSQGNRNEKGTFSPRQQPPRLISEKQCSQYSDLSYPLKQIGRRKNLDEDEFAVPFFMHSRPIQVNDREKATPLNPAYFNHSLKFAEPAKTGVIGHVPRQEGKIHKEWYSQESVVGQNQVVKAVSNSSIVNKNEEQLKRTYSSSSHEPRNNHSNRVNLPELPAEAQRASGVHGAVSRECVPALIKRNCSVSSKDFRLKDQDIVHDVANDGKSRTDRSCGSPPMGNLARCESVSETFIGDALSGLDITPDDVVGIIGQRHFWKARRTISIQQRVFAYQVFELHRLIKVQKGMALSSHHLLEDVAVKPIKPAVPPKVLPLDYPNVARPKVSECVSVNSSHKNQDLVQNSVGKPSIFAAQSGGNSQAPSRSSKQTSPGSGAFNQTQPHGHQWLIPMMSPSEGLVYKPYPGNGFVFSLQHPPFAFPVTHGYFSPYCMPTMSSTDQRSTRETDLTIQRDVNVDAPKDIEVQCSSSPVPGERLQGRGAMNSRDVLPLFPVSPTLTVDDATPSSSPHHSHPEHPPTRVIKVIPRHSKSASESAARIFRSIQEERRRYDSSV